MKRHAALFLAAALLTACSVLGEAPESTPSPYLEDRSTLTGVPCAAPCWQGLLVGKSTEGDVRAALARLTFIDQHAVTWSSRESALSLDTREWVPATEVSAACLRYPHQPCLMIQLVEGVVTGIVLQPNYDLKVGDVLTHLGTPDYLANEPLATEVIWCQFHLVWNQKQLVLSSQIFKGIPPDACDSLRTTGRVPGSLQLVEISYLSPRAVAWYARRYFEYYTLSLSTPDPLVVPITPLP